jgi:hypothetical protein
LADSCLDVRVSSDHSAVFLEKVDGSVFQHYGGKEALKYVRGDASRNHPEELASGTRYLACDDYGSPIRDTTLHQFDQNRPFRRFALKLLKVVPI